MLINTLIQQSQLIRKIILIDIQGLEENNDDQLQEAN